LRWRRRAGRVAAGLALLPVALGIAGLLPREDGRVDVVASTPTTEAVNRDAGITPRPDADRVRIRRIDTTEFPKVSVVTMSSRPLRPSELELLENGRPVTARRVGSLEAPKGVVIVVDSSGSMAERGRLTMAKAAIRQFVNAKQPQDQMAIVGFSNRPELIKGLTGDSQALQASVDSLQADNETALWDGVSAALRVFEQAPGGLQPNLVVITDGRDTVSSTDFAAVRAAAVAAHASIFAIGIEGPELDRAPLDELARATNGTLQLGPPGALARLLGNAGVLLDAQYALSYTSRAIAPLELEVRAGGARDRVVGVGSGTVVEGHAHETQVIETRRSPRWLGSPYSRSIISCFVVVAIALLGYGLLGPSRRRGASEGVA
jgi:hypothetical protein